MTPRLLKTLVIQPVLAELNWPQPGERAVLLTAIAIQESGLKYRRQQPSGPGRSWWQIEPPTCFDCLVRCLPARDLWNGLTGERDSRDDLEHNDLAACAVAAGILRLTPGRLPEVGDMAGAWHYYLKAWRPGKPRLESWQNAYEKAVAA